MPGETKDELGNVLNGSQSTSQTATNYQIKTASFPSGVHDAVGAGYMFTANIGIELNADLTIAPNKYDFTEIGITSNSQTANLTYTRQSNTMIDLMPSLVLQTAGKTVNAYMRMGIALPINNGIQRHDIYQYQTGRVDVKYWKISNYFSLGYTATAGIKYQIGKYVSLWTELSMLQLSLSREEADLSGYTANGVSYNVAQLSGGIKTYHYIKNGTSDPSTETEQTFSQPYSNLAFIAGIEFELQHRTGKKAEQREWQGTWKYFLILLPTFILSLILITC